MRVRAGDALRFLTAGVINTAITSIAYLLFVTALRPEFAYALAWCVGLIFVVKYYPEKVFVNSNPTSFDRVGIAGITLFSFGVGVVMIGAATRWLGSHFGALILTLIVTTLLNFSLSTLLLRRKKS